MYYPDGQYICVTKESNNLNIEYQKLKNKNIDSTNRSTFLVNDSDLMGDDVLFKLQALQKEVDHTYIAAFIEDETQYIQPKDQVVEDHYSAKRLNEDINIAVEKNKLFELVHYFDKTGVDYIFSPFSILNEHNVQNPESNSLLILIYNNKIYALVVDQFAKVIFSKVLTITEFDDIETSEFYNDQIMKQNLYDEVYQLELTNHLKNIMGEFYQSGSEIFIEKINILYTVKQLQREQITKIQNELMLKIDYHPISMDEMVFEIIKTKDTSTMNFITPRVKKAKSKQSYLILFAILAVMGAIYYLFTSQTSTLPQSTAKVETPIQKVEPKKEPEKKTQEKVELPKHIDKNTQISELTLSLLETIPYDMVLQKLVIEKDSSTMDATLITKDLFAKSLKDDLLAIYNKSEIEFKDENASKGEYKVTITNKEPKEVKSDTKSNILYSDKIFLTKQQIDSTLNKTLPQSAQILFDSVFKSEMVTFNYKISLKESSPKVFFEIIDKLNNLSNSIHINYPIAFEIKDNKLKIDFNLQVHQYK